MSYLGRDVYYGDEDISKRVEVSNNCKKAIVGIGPSRSGTTLFARIFAEQGIQTWYQPFKAILRGYIHNNNVSVSFNNEVVFIKEALGAYTKNEASIDPINILVSSGMDKSGIHVILLVRHPFNTALSVLENFSKLATDYELIETLIQCYQTIDKILLNANKLNISVSVFAYEMWNQIDNNEIMNQMFNRCDLTFKRSRFSSWKSLNSLSDLNELVILDEPEFYYHTDFFKKVKIEKKINPQPAYEIERLPRRYLSMLERSSVFETYERCLNICKDNFKIHGHV